MPIIVGIVLFIKWGDLDFFVISIAILLGFCLAIVTAGIATLILPYEYEKIETVELIAFTGENGFSGSFLLGSGHVESRYKYRYLTSTEDGGIIMREIDYQDTILYEADSTPKLEKWYPMYKSKIARTLFVSPLEDIIYKIYIPPNSIIYEYNLEL
jgi:hypothetical protein